MTGLRNTVALCVFVVCVFWAIASAKAEGAAAPRAICAVFVRDCANALAVAWCESRFDVNARNGQYLGLFQMGAWERRKYGHGPDAWAQSRAAYRYFVATGSDWSPWSCQP